MFTNICLQNMYFFPPQMLWKQWGITNQLCEIVATILLPDLPIIIMVPIINTQPLTKKVPYHYRKCLPLKIITKKHVFNMLITRFCKFYVLILNDDLSEPNENYKDSLYNNMLKWKFCTLLPKSPFFLIYSGSQFLQGKSM